MNRRAWCLKMPSGALDLSSVRPTKVAVWDATFNTVAWALGEPWRQKYWKRWDASVRSAAREGFQIVRVRIVEEGKR